MKHWIALALFAAAPAVASAPPELDVTGTWVISGDVQGNPVNETCHVTQTEVVLSGQCDTDSGKWDLKGKIDGRTASFTHAGKYQGMDYMATYTGKVAADGTMTGTIDVDPFNVTGSFSGRKNDTAAPTAPADPPKSPAPPAA